MNMHNLLFWDQERVGRRQIADKLPEDFRERVSFLLESLAYASTMASWYADKQHDNSELYRYLGQINAIYEALSHAETERVSRSIQSPVWTME